MPRLALLLGCLSRKERLCEAVSGFLPTAPTQGKQPLRQDLLEEPCAPA